MEPRRRRGRLGLIMLIALLLVITGTVIFLISRKTSSHPIYSVVPPDAIFAIETSNLTQGWETVSASAQWKHLLSNEYFAFLNEDAQYLDSLIRGNRLIGNLMKDRRLVISAHLVSSRDYDFLFVVDMKKAERFSFLTDLISGDLSLRDYDISKREFEGREIIELTYRKDGDVLYILLEGNLLVCSYDKGILERAASCAERGSLEDEAGFQSTRASVRQSRLFNFYFNFRMLDPFLGVFFSQRDEMAIAAGKALQFSGFEVSLKDERARFEGLTLLDDSMASYLGALSTVEPGRSRIEGILSERTALFLTMTFDEYRNFFEALSLELQSEDSVAFAEYQRNLTRFEKTFGIDLEKDLFSWIGNEIAFIKLQPSADTKEKDFVVALHASDISEAMAGMERIITKVKRRSPWQINNTRYKDHDIKYFQLKGFFKLFFGKLFGKLEEPYFTFMDDYVVFSNTSSTLIDMIDDLALGKTLDHEEDFMDFRSDFSSRSNVSIFIRTPKVYNHLLYYANAKNREGLEQNKDLFLSYSRIGIQLSSAGNGFETLIIADHEPEALANAEWEEVETTAEEMFISGFDINQFRVTLDDAEKLYDGFVRRYYTDSTLRAEGLVLNGTLSGLWRTYHYSGYLQSAVTYADGVALGIATFYYDKPGSPKQAEVYFREDQVTDIYLEFYRNGSRKAMVEFDKGIPDGDAEFYYESGALMLKGQYRKGHRTGKWKHYSETGEILEKESTGK